MEGINTFLVSHGRKQLLLVFQLSPLIPPAAVCKIAVAGTRRGT